MPNESNTSNRSRKMATGQCSNLTKDDTRKLILCVGALKRLWPPVLLASPAMTIRGGEVGEHPGCCCRISECRLSSVGEVPGGRVHAHGLESNGTSR